MRAAASSEREIARFALPYAELVSYLRPPEKRDLSPPGYIRGPDSTEWFRAYDPGAAAWATLTSFYAATFFHCTTRTMVVAFESINPIDPRDLVVSVSRQIFGGWSPFALRFAEAMQAAYPDYEITLAGHSGGSCPLARSSSRSISMRSVKVPAMSGSNCVPEQRSISLTVTSCGSARR